MFVRVAVADGDGVRDGASVRVAVGLGVADAVGVDVLVRVAVTVGRAVQVAVGLGVGLATVGEMRETGCGVGLVQQPARKLAVTTNSRNTVDTALPPFLPDPRTD